MCTHTPKPLDSIRNPEAKNFEAESGAIDRLVSCRARLSTLDLWYSTDLDCSYSCTFTYTFWLCYFICSLLPTHGCLCLWMHARHQYFRATADECLPAWVYIVCAHCTVNASNAIKSSSWSGVCAFGANRRQLWPLQHQWHSWLVPFSMLDLASLERMWLGRHTEEVKWGVRGGDGRTTARLLQRPLCSRAGRKAKSRLIKILYKPAISIIAIQ